MVETAIKGKKIPVTVITGFLGSGKTTLINRVLTETHGIRFAVIENEFGEVGIDQDLVLNEKEEVIEMNNGCICCTVRGDLIRLIVKLAASENPPEHILIETTGLADPSPVAQTFLTNPEVEAVAFLDAIVTLVDARHIEQQLASTPEAKDQIAFADIILINKIDLVDTEHLHQLEERVREINRFATLYTSEKSDIDLKRLFNVGGFDVNRALTIDPKFMEIEYPFEYGGIYHFTKGTYSMTLSPNGEEETMRIIFAKGSEGMSVPFLEKIANTAALMFSGPTTEVYPGQKVLLENTFQKLFVKENDARFVLTIPEDGEYVLFTEHHPQEFAFAISDMSGEENSAIALKEFRPAHEHDATITSVGIERDGAIDPNAFMKFLETIVHAFGNDLYRFKGMLSIEGEPNKVVLQGVHMLYEVQLGARWGKEEKRKNTIVFIGKNLERNILTQGFLSCLNDTNADSAI